MLQSTHPIPALSLKFIGRPSPLKVLSQYIHVQQKDVASRTLFNQICRLSKFLGSRCARWVSRCARARSSLGLPHSSIARLSTILRWLSLTSCKSDGQLVVDRVLLPVGEGGHTGATGPDSIWALVWASLGRVGAPKQNMLASSQRWEEAKPNRENKRVQTATASN